MMKELEGAIGGMDDDNPDPKQMGALMRKMCAMTGEKMDESMESSSQIKRTLMSWKII